jgi:hypothetical protein
MLALLRMLAARAAARYTLQLQQAAARRGGQVHFSNEERAIVSYKKLRTIMYICTNIVLIHSIRIIIIV